MTEKEESGRSKREWKSGVKKSGSGPGGAAYFLGFIGALVYYLQQASSFGSGVIGILKAIVWPAFLVYHVLLYLRA